MIGTLIRKKENSLLSAGYKAMNGRGGQGLLSDFESVYPNSLVSILKNAYFAELSACVGESAFKYLLLNTSLYMKAENGCFIQLCGEPLNPIKMNPLNCIAATRKNLGDTLIQWTQVMYGKPVYTKTGAISASLMPTRT